MLMCGREFDSISARLNSSFVSNEKIRKREAAYPHVPWLAQFLLLPLVAAFDGFTFTSSTRIHGADE